MKGSRKFFVIESEEEKHIISWYQYFRIFEI